MRRPSFVLIAAVLGIALQAAGAAQQSATGSAVRVIPIRGNLHLLQGAGVNIVASVGKDGVLLVDTGVAEMSEAVLGAIRQLQRDLDLREQPTGFAAETRSSVAHRHVEAPPKPIRYILNTSAGVPHVGANEKLRLSGRTFTGGNVAGNIADAAEGAAILAHENVAQRMAAGEQPAAADALPTDTYFNDMMKMSHFFNGEGVQLIHQPAAYSDGDSLVMFRGTDVIAAGEIYSTVGYPVIDRERGGTIDGVVDGLNRILALSMAEFRTEGGTLVVPSRGRLSDSADVAYYRDMVTIIRDRIKAMVEKGMTLEQVKAARPTADYEPRYGSTTGSWTTDMFIEAAYVTLGGGKAAPQRSTRSTR
jgi:glyoxylase-like metal-dependent hydrolase (beta-lactamase superfamily II)